MLITISASAKGWDFNPSTMLAATLPVSSTVPMACLAKKREDTAPSPLLSMNQILSGLLGHCTALRRHKIPLQFLIVRRQSPAAGFRGCLDHDGKVGCWLLRWRIGRNDIRRRLRNRQRMRWLQARDAVIAYKYGWHRLVARALALWHHHAIDDYRYCCHVSSPFKSPL